MNGAGRLTDGTGRWNWEIEQMKTVGADTISHKFRTRAMCVVRILLVQSVSRNQSDLNDILRSLLDLAL